MELGQFAEDMRRYLLGETPFPVDMAVIVMVCKDEYSRRLWNVPHAFVGAGCLNVVFDARGMRFRILMGHVPWFAAEADCRGPSKPIFLADEKSGRGRHGETFRAPKRRIKTELPDCQDVVTLRSPAERRSLADNSGPLRFWVSASDPPATESCPSLPTSPCALGSRLSAASRV